MKKTIFVLVIIIVMIIFSACNTQAVEETAIKKDPDVNDIVGSYTWDDKKLDHTETMFFEKDGTAYNDAGVCFDWTLDGDEIIMIANGKTTSGLFVSGWKGSETHLTFVFGSPNYIIEHLDTGKDVYYYKN